MLKEHWDNLETLEGVVEDSWFVSLPESEVLWVKVVGEVEGG